MKITILFEGQTEKAFLKPLQLFLRPRLARMPVLDPFPCKTWVPVGAELKKTVEQLLMAQRDPSDEVIVLTDVYTGINPPRFENAADAKAKMMQWVGANEHFHPHAAQYEFETWLLPYWDRIKMLAGHNMAPPGVNPEQVNHGNPPSRRLSAIYRAGKQREYSKTRDVLRILDKQDLVIAADQCPELKAFLNTILRLCGGEQLR